jgi:uncharacterized protein
MVENRVGAPVRGADFYGREAFVKHVSERLRTGHVLLAAPRRFGKTSVRYRLIDEPQWDYRIVHADLEYMTEPAAFVSELILKLAQDSKLAKALSKLSYAPKELWERIRANIEEVELYEVKVKLKEKISPSWQESGEELFRRVAESKTTVVFFLDEFPMMIDRMARSEKYREEAKTLLRWLRALRHQPGCRNVRFLIAGSIGIGRVLDELGEIAAINDFEPIRLDPFPPKVAAAFLRELATSAGLPLSPACRRKMLEVVGTPVPYFLQILFSKVRESHALDGEPISPKKIELIYRNKVLGVDSKTYFGHYYGRLSEYYSKHEESAAKRILRELAVVKAMTRDACYQFYREAAGSRAEIEGFNRLMSDLENDFYVTFDGAARRYGFSCKLLQDWWLRHYGMEVV